MQYRVLGPLEIVGEGGAVALGGPRPRALVALLLAADGQQLPIETVADELWAGEPPPSAAATLHTYVSRLRRVLPAGVLNSERGAYSLVPDGPVDRDEFKRAVADGRAALAQNDTERAVRLLTDALARWRGEAFPELGDSDRARAVVAQLDELRRAAEEDRFDALLAGGRDAEVVPELEAAVIAQPLRERRWGQLMLALYRSGRQADALARYQALRAHLADELGLDPSSELSRLEQQILLQDPALLLPTAELPPAPARSLPTPVTTFVGRDFETAELSEAVRANRLVTVTGPGGVGKSRLAVELVRAHNRDEPGDLVVFAEIAGVTDPALLPAAVAGALGIDESGGTPIETALGGLLGDGRGAVIVLDNCEHLLDGVAELADRLLVGVPDLRIVATSREPLGVLGEAVWRVAPMPVDDAVLLFADRAGQAVTDADQAVVRAVCERLDGLPLAIELAAARLRTMSFAQLLDGLDDRFRLLGSGPRAAPERQRSLRALVQWSYDLLSPDDQRLLAAVSVFAGSFDAPAAEAVGALARGEGVSRLADLADKSLVALHPGNRYRILETIRQFAAEQLAENGDEARARNAHLDWFDAFATSMATELRGSNQRDAFDRCDVEQDNVRHALEWAVADPERAPRALGIAVGVWRNWLVKGHLSEGRQLFAAALAAAPEPSPARAWALQRAGCLAESHGDLDGAIALAEQAIALARAIGEIDVEALALNELANAERAAGDLDTALTHAQEAVVVARNDRAQPFTRYTCAMNLANTLLRDGRYGEARALYEEALPYVRKSGDEFALGIALQNLGVATYQAGDYEASLEYIDDGALIAEKIDNKQGLAMTFDMRAQIEAARGNYDVALANSRDALALLRELGNSFVVSIALGTAASIKLLSGDDPQPEIDEKRAIDLSIGFVAGEAEGLLMQGRLHLRNGDLERAQRIGERAIARARESDHPLTLAETLALTARVMRGRGDEVRATELFTEAIAVWRDVGHDREADAAEAERADC